MNRTGYGWRIALAAIATSLSGVAYGTLCRAEPETKDANDVIHILEQIARQVARNSDSIPTKARLKGRVQMSDRRPPAESRLREGITFAQDSGQTALTANNFWYRVPDWYAGTWQSAGNTVLSGYNFKSNQFIGHSTTRHTKFVTFGFQRDSNGDIWDFDGRPQTATSEKDKTVDTDLLHEIISADDVRVDKKVTCTRCTIDLRTNKIIHTCQIEGIGASMRDGPAGRAEAQQIKTFDQDGNPVDTVTIVGRSWKIAPFQQVNQYEGQDMRKLFKEYLVTHGLNHLVPASD